MEKMKVEIISTETIRPSSPTPTHLRTYKMSRFDQISPKVYLPIIFYYPVSEDHLNVKQISARLKDSLSETLSRFHPLAGRIKNEDASVDCNDEGVMFSEARVNCDLLEVLRDPKTDLLSQFLPCSLVPTVPLDAVPQVAVQLNIFESGGIVIGFCSFHLVADGTSWSAFLKCWSSIARGSYSYDEELISPDFSVTSKLFPPMESQKSNAFLIDNRWLSLGRGVRRRFVFDAAAISVLKGKAASQIVPEPSRFEAVSAFVWKSALAASRAAFGSHKLQPSIMSFPANMRPRTVLPLSKNPIGNCAWGVVVPYPAEETELQGLVGRIRAEIEKIDNNFVLSLQDGEKFRVITKSREEPEEIYPNAKPEMYAFTNWCKLGYNEVDFGWGKPIWVSNIGGDSNAYYIRNVILMETSCGQGIEAWMMLHEKVMEILENDAEFSAMATLNPSIADRASCHKE
ncbi:unnamed protein product [Ilex paraguariensis]|uniref:Uncharacterized protein n=1 Tax=Ilex paraguariensis TaxID=185542 RepID=A0ABC8U7A8_9AQUA